VQSTGLGAGVGLASPESLGLDTVLFPGRGDADVTHGVGCVGAASLPGAGGRSGSRARGTPIAAAVLLALPAGSQRCQLEGSGLCSQLPCSGARWLRRRKALSAGLPAAHAVPADVPAARRAEPTQHLPFWAALSGMCVGSSVRPRASTGRAARPRVHPVTSPISPPPQSIPWKWLFGATAIALGGVALSVVIAARN